MVKEKARGDTRAYLILGFALPRAGSGKSQKP